MSARTIARRRKEAGLINTIVPAWVDTAIIDHWCDELAWLTGLIWSDGCLRRNTIEICSKDFQLIDLVLSLVGGRYGLKNQGQHLKIAFTSAPMSTFFRSIGLTERKSLTIGWPIMPIEYTGAFMRGLIDGDGSVLLAQRRDGQQSPDLSVQLVTASPLLRDGVTDWFSLSGIRFSLSERAPRTTQEHQLWKFTVVHQESLRTLHGLLYPSESSVCLHRKRIPFDTWIATPRARSGRPKR